MLNRLKITIVIIIFGSSVNIATFSQKPTTEERLIRLEEGQKTLAQRIDDTNKRIDDLNHRIDVLRKDMNNGFATLRQDMNQRFEDLRFWLQIVLSVLVAVIAGLIVQIFLIWRRLIKVETQGRTSCRNGKGQIDSLLS